MHDVISEMLNLFGISIIPTDFPSFMVWLCSLIAGVLFVKFTVGVSLSFARKALEVSK